MNLNASSIYTTYKLCFNRFCKNSNCNNNFCICIHLLTTKFYRVTKLDSQASHHLGIRNGKDIFLFVGLFLDTITLKGQLNEGAVCSTSWLTAADLVFNSWNWKEEPFSQDAELETYDLNSINLWSQAMFLKIYFNGDYNVRDSRY